MRDLIDRLTEHLGLDPIAPIEPITEQVRFPHMSRELREHQPTTPAATPEDQIARDAVAAIEREDGYDACANARLRGAYDGDPEHRIALKAIELFQRQQMIFPDAQPHPLNPVCKEGGNS